LEKAEAAIITGQFVALIAIVLLLANYTPGQSSLSYPVVSSVYWGSPGNGVSLQKGQTMKVMQNESEVTAYFTVAFSTSVSAVSASRLCVDPANGAGVSTTYNTIQFGYDSAKSQHTVTVSPTVQQPGWECTYTITITDGLSQTATWLGTVEFLPPAKG
jgi:hypothetical protein